jgi:hypothetical protein
MGLFGQVRFDYEWLMGYPSGSDTVGQFNGVYYNGTKIDFKFSPPQVTMFDIPFMLDATALICDSSGDLLFYTNGCQISNRNHERMANGDEINKGGAGYAQQCLDKYPFSYSVHQGVMILPWPGRAKKYILFHLHKPDPISRVYNENLKYTVIDMEEDGGLGAVIEKNHQVFQDTFCDMLTAVRHANGRDWWLVVPKYNDGRYFVFLLSPEGISGPTVQDIGAPIPHSSWGGQAVFSPNGKKYVNMSYLGGLQVFDFDRCSGNMKSVFHSDNFIFSTDILGSNACGVAFSPSSRFLYVVSGINLYQFDMRADDVLSSQVHIGEYDGFGYLNNADISLPTTFYQMRLAPDGKIYMSTSNGSHYLHVLHQPDSIGLACNFQQRAMNLPTFHSFSISNFPHFRLYDLPGSPCDTLGINGPQPPEDTLPPPPVCGTFLSLWPNPVSSVASVELPDCQGGLLSIFDSAGRLISEQRIAPGEGAHPIVVSEYVPGIYFVRFWPDKEGEVVVRGLSVVR